MFCCSCKLQDSTCRWSTIFTKHAPYTVCSEHYILIKRSLYSYSKCHFISSLSINRSFLSILLFNIWSFLFFPFKKGNEIFEIWNVLALAVNWKQFSQSYASCCFRFIYLFRKGIYSNRAWKGWNSVLTLLVFEIINTTVIKIRLLVAQFRNHGIF